MSRTYGYFWYGDLLSKKFNYQNKDWFKSTEFYDFLCHYMPRNTRHQGRGGRTHCHCRKKFSEHYHKTRRQEIQAEIRMLDNKD